MPGPARTSRQGTAVTPTAAAPPPEKRFEISNSGTNHPFAYARFSNFGSPLRNQRLKICSANLDLACPPGRPFLQQLPVCGLVPVICKPSLNWFYEDNCQFLLCQVTPIWRTRHRVTAAGVTDRANGQKSLIVGFVFSKTVLWQNGYAWACKAHTRGFDSLWHLKPGLPQ